MKTKKGTGIFTKMIGIFGILTLVIGALWVASLIFFYQRSDRASTAHSFANEIDIWMLQARRNEKDSQLRDIKTGDFYDKGTGANLELHAKSMNELNKAIDRLEALHQVKKQSTEDLRAAVAEYDKSFTNIVAAYKQLGFQDWGAEGAWRVAAHDIEERLSAVRNPALMISLLEVRRHEKDYLLRSDKSYLDQLTAEVGNLRAGVSRVGEPSRSALLADIDKYTTSVQNYVDLQNQIGLTENEGLQGTMRDAIHKVEPLVASVVDETKKLSQSQDAYRELLLSILAIMVGGLVVGGLVFALFARTISSPIRKVVGLLENLAKGDLRESVGQELLRKRDEVGLLAAALETTSQRLREMVATIHESSSQVASSSEEISASAQQLSEGAQSQASSLEETSASVEELTSSVVQVAEHSQGQSSAVEQGTASMAQVQKSVEEVSANLNEISSLAAQSVDNALQGSKAVAQVVTVINLIAQSSERIGGIVNVISDIADQTNLLALNASIEAARAGEHGRGFAVVADEVSKLADRSASSTKEIEALIKDSVRNVTEGVKTAQGSQSAMEQIREASQKVKDMIVSLSESMKQQVAAIHEVASALGNINEMSSSISAATEEQTTNAKQVSTAVENVNEITQTAASAAEEMSSATEQLSGMAQELTRLMSQFKIGDSTKAADGLQQRVSGLIERGHSDGNGHQGSAGESSRLPATASSVIKGEKSGE